MMKMKRVSLHNWTGLFEDDTLERGLVARCQHVAFDEDSVVHDLKEGEMRWIDREMTFVYRNPNIFSGPIARVNFFSKQLRGIIFEEYDYKVVAQTSMGEPPEQLWYSRTVLFYPEVKEYLTARNWRIVWEVDLSVGDPELLRDGRPDISHTWQPPEKICLRCPNYLACLLGGRFL